MREIHVALSGRDLGCGDVRQPYRTISRAADLAQPGDTVIVHEGTYREWVSPRYGGSDDQHRITYLAAPRERVVIKGSETLDRWEHVEGAVWMARVPNSLFTDGNPYRDLLGGDWFIDQGRDHHAGEVFLNGRALSEAATLDAVKAPLRLDHTLHPEGSTLAWYCKAESDATLIYANFRGADPNDELVEITVRPACFFPRQTGVNYITVRGFEMCQAAVPWAPPTAFQMGLLGPHWSKGWVIEDNVVHDAKCSGISLGKERASGENEWSRLKVKHGTQREREVVFRAMRLGWSREHVGSHVVRNNTIYDCGQAGICGHLGSIFSVITDNHIHHIHANAQFTGHEMAGIKIHAPIDTLIARNHIHHCTQGIWLDWQSQGVRVTGNLLYENRWNDIHVEVSHGPYIVDNNLFLSPLAIKNVSQGGAYLHNLIAGRVRVQSVPNRYTPYHVPHSTEVAGLMTILNGDDRFHNNLFVPMNPMRESERQNITIPDEAAEQIAHAPTPPPVSREAFGLSVYNGFPLDTSEWSLSSKVDSYAVQKLPVDIRSNVYCGSAEPFDREDTPVATAAYAVSLETSRSSVTIHLTIDWLSAEQLGAMVSTESLGTAFEPEAPFMNPDGSRLVVDTDYYGHERGERSSAGPFESLRSGENVLVVWPRS